LEHAASKISTILRAAPDAILAFPGVFRSIPNILSATPGIVNLTASTTRSKHTRKVQVGTVHQAVQLGLDAVAVHVNIGSEYESEMLKTLGSVSEECEMNGMPILAIMYPRSEAGGSDDNYDELKEMDRRSYAQLVAHAARVGVDLGADLIKTKYTGDPDSFRLVVEACEPTPVIVAGGPLLPAERMFQVTHDVIVAGGAGVSFGRNVFSRPDPAPFITGLKAVIHECVTVAEAIQRYELKLSTNSESGGTHGGDSPK
jgi:DhnA family fructose-bisphosphate aldolase class Ia